jgi:hypothetical protein
MQNLDLLRMGGESLKMGVFSITPTPHPCEGKDEAQAAAIMLFIVGMRRAIRKS